MHDCESVYGALAAALRPGNVLGVTGGAEVPGVEVGLVTGVALAEPQLVGLGLLPVEVGLWAGEWGREGCSLPYLFSSYEVTRRYLLVGGQDNGAGGGQGAARAVDQAGLGARDLPVSALASQLPGGLQQEEHAVHAGVAVGKSAAVGVHWEVAAGCGALVGDEVGALAPSAEAEGLQGDEDRVGEGVVDHGEVDVGVLETLPFPGTEARSPWL